MMNYVPILTILERTILFNKLIQATQMNQLSALYLCFIATPFKYTSILVALCLVNVNGQWKNPLFYESMPNKVQVFFEPKKTQTSNDQKLSENDV